MMEILCSKDTSHWFLQPTKMLAFDDANFHVSEIFQYSRKKKFSKSSKVYAFCTPNFEKT